MVHARVGPSVMVKHRGTSVQAWACGWACECVCAFEWLHVGDQG